MESDELRQSLRQAERAEASTWIDFPPTPGWWAPLFGLWSVIEGLNIGYLDGLGQALTSLGLVLVMVGLVAWQRRYRGTYPQGRAPREINRLILVLMGAALVLVLTAWAIGATTMPWVGALGAGAGAWALVDWYERRYAAASARVRERLDGAVSR